MIYFIPALVVFLTHLYLLWAWWRARKKKDGREKMFCLLGFLLGQLYLVWELILVKQTGRPLPNSPQQNMLMLRFLLGAAPGGFFVILGLFYISFAGYGTLKDSDNKE